MGTHAALEHGASGSASADHGVRQPGAAIAAALAAICRASAVLGGRQCGLTMVASPGVVAIRELVRMPASRDGWNALRAYLEPTDSDDAEGALSLDGAQVDADARNAQRCVALAGLASRS